MTLIGKTAFAAVIAAVAFPAFAQDLPKSAVSPEAYATADKVLENHYLITADGAIVGVVTGVATTADGEAIMQVDVQFGVPADQLGIATVVATEATEVNGQYIVPISSTDLVLRRG